MLIKKIKNNTASIKHYVNQNIDPAEYYQIQRHEEKAWIDDTTVIADIISGDLIMNNGTTDLSAAIGLVWLSAINPGCVETEIFDLGNGVNPPHKEGRFFYDHAEHAYAMYNDATDVTHQLGQEFLIRVYNDSGSLIVDGKPVYVTGTEVVENRPTVALAMANTDATSKVIGISTHSIPDGTFGWVTFLGLVNSLDTTAFSSGDHLYLDESVSGGYRTSPPPNGNMSVHLGYCIRSHATEGRLLILVGDPVATTASAFGSEYDYIDSDPESSTSSATFQNKLTLNTSSLPSGDYRIGYSFETHVNSNNVSCVCEIKVGGVVIGAPAPESHNHWEGFSGQKKLNLSGIQTLEVNYKSGNGTAIVKIRNARLEIWKVG